MLNSLHKHRNLNLIVDKLLGISRESGFSTDDIVKHAKIDLSKPIQEVEMPRIIESIYNHTKDKALMIKLGQRLDLTFLGSFGFALMSCTDFTAVVKLINRYKPLLGSGMSLKILSDSHNSNYNLRVSNILSNNLQTRLINELIISQAIYLIKIITNNDKLNFKVTFKHEGINNKELYESILNCDVKFNPLPSNNRYRFINLFTALKFEQLIRAKPKDPKKVMSNL